MTLPDGPPEVRTLSWAHARNLRGYLSDPLAFVANRFATYGDPYLARTGGELLFVFKHPDHLAEVLQRQADAFVKEEFGLQKVLGRGLLTSEGAHWRHRRSMIQPAFSRPALQSYGAVMVEETERAIEGLRWGDRLDACVTMTRLTLAIVARALFSHRISDDADAVGTAMSRFQEAIGAFDPLPDWLPTPKHLRIRRSLRAMDELVFGLIDARRTARQRGDAPRGDLLDALLSASGSEDGAHPSLAEDRAGLRDELLTLIMAGHETTANATSWALLLLAQHPDVDGRLAAELRDVLGPRPVRVDDLAELPYLRAVCHEVLRVYPPAYVLARRSTRDVEIGGYTMPANQPAVLWIYMTHHDERWYPRPERFEPERFLGAAAASRPKLAWLPFGAGARMCIGKHFALMEMQLVLATLLRRARFEVEPGVNVRPRPRVTLTPAGGVPGRFRRRT